MVGCPVAHRSWILDRWFDAVELSCSRADVVPEFAFAVDKEDECLDVIARRAPAAHVVLVEPSKPTDIRRWNPQRYAYMVAVRNRLLDQVRQLSPTAFLSVDSDILIHRDLVARLTEDLADGRYAAVGGKCYMTASGVNFPSWGRLSRQGTLLRYEAIGYFPVDVIMAIKLMGPDAYAVDYEVDLQGEDIGWSKACARNGLRLAWDGRIGSKHILQASMLGRADSRVGW